MSAYEWLSNAFDHTHAHTHSNVTRISNINYVLTALIHSLWTHYLNTNSVVCVYVYLLVAQSA